MGEAMARWDKVGALDHQTFADISCHTGFFHQYESVHVKIGELVKEFISTHAKDNAWDLLVTGHSMGGALARLCAFDLLALNIAKKSQTHLITFGAGPCGNEVFSKALDTLLGVDDDPLRNLHFVQNNDPIPKLALSAEKGGFAGGLVSLGCKHYVHGGILAWFNFDGDLQNPGTTRKCRRLCAYACGLCVRGVNFPMLDHPPCRYIQSIGKQCKESGGSFEATLPDPNEWEAAKLVFKGLKDDGLDGALREILRYCGSPAASPDFQGYAKDDGLDGA